MAPQSTEVTVSETLVLFVLSCLRVPKESVFVCFVSFVVKKIGLRLEEDSFPTTKSTEVAKYETLVLFVPFCG